MFSGLIGHCYFGPAEIDALRRAQALADRALRAEALPDMAFNHRRQAVARMIIQIAAHGIFDPLVLSAQALRAQQTQLLPASTFRPYERRPVSSRLRIRRVAATRKIA